VRRHKLKASNVLRAGFGLAISVFLVWLLISKLNRSQGFALLLAFLLGTLILERALDLLSLLTIWLIAITTTHFRLLRAALVLVLTMAAKIESLLVRIVYRYFGDGPIIGKIIFSIRPVFSVFKDCGPRLILPLIALSGGAWGLEGAVFWTVAKALHLHMLSLFPWLAFVFGNFAAMIPGAPGYIGTFHAAVITVLVTTGCEQNAAASFAILVHAVIWICMTSADTMAYFVSFGEKQEVPEVTMISVPDAGQRREELPLNEACRRYWCRVYWIGCCARTIGTWL
jgi:uncharacterized membrane protein YbhN (UPF0104 family)